MPKQVVVVQSLKEEKIIKGVKRMTRMRWLLVGIAVLIIGSIIFMNLNEMYGWFAFPAF